MRLVVTIVALLLAVPLFAVALLAFWSWRKERAASRVHRNALDRVSSAEISSRALQWLDDGEWGNAPAIQELRRLVEQGRYRAILKRWRRYHAALLSAHEWDPREGPPRTWILRDYLRVLDEREASAPDTSAPVRS